ncbi:MAG: SDR family NAD(P)-dependent oxidoreductase [Cyanobacteria bacterium P01_F01_bin.53]
MRKKINSFQDLRVVITGASGGIGSALSMALARQDARLALVARQAEGLEALATQLKAISPNLSMLSIVNDVGDRLAVNQACEQVVSAWGGIDLLINNAGCAHHSLFIATDLALADNILQTNVTGVMNWTKAVLPVMVAQQSGWIVFVSSIAGRVGVPDESVYVASKFAVTGFAEALSMEVESDGIHVTTVFPLAVDTPFFSAHARQRLPPRTVQTMISPEVVAQQIIQGLQKGDRSFTVPRRYKFIFGIKALWPDFFRAQTKKTVMDHLEKL